jgi:hypothetical protein
MTVPLLTYLSETGPLKNRTENETAEIKLLRPVSAHNLYDHAYINTIPNDCNIFNLEEKI